MNEFLARWFSVNTLIIILAIIAEISAILSRTQDLRYGSFRGDAIILSIPFIFIITVVVYSVFRLLYSASKISKYVWSKTTPPFSSSEVPISWIQSRDTDIKKSGKYFISFLSVAIFLIIIENWSYVLHPIDGFILSPFSQGIGEIAESKQADTIISPFTYSVEFITAILELFFGLDWSDDFWFVIGFIVLPSIPLLIATRNAIYMLEKHFYRVLEEPIIFSDQGIHKYAVLVILLNIISTPITIAVFAPKP